MITAIDVGATKTLVGQFKDGKPVSTQRFATPQNVDDFFTELHSRLAKLPEITAISLALPGMVTPEGVLLKAGILPWKNIPFHSLLTTTYHCPVYVENDAKLAAFFEVNSLTAPPRMGMYITLSTGIGSGLVIDGELLPQLDYCEPGHMSLWFDGQLRVWQDFASGRAIAAHFGKEASELHTPQEWREVAKRVSPGLLALIPALQPDIIIFGGGMGQYFTKFKEPLEQEVRSHLAPYITMPHLQVATHPHEEVLYGCFRYALHKQPTLATTKR